MIQPKKPTDLTPLASYLQSLATGDTAAIEARDGSKKHEKTDQFNLRWLTLVDTRSWCDAVPCQRGKIMKTTAARIPIISKVNGSSKLAYLGWR